MDEAAPASLCERLAARGFDVEATREGHARVVLAPERALDALTRLRDDPELALRRLVDLTALDRGAAPRFEVVYSLRPSDANGTVRVHVPVDEPEPTLDSVVPVWPAADWLEREVYDLFGIRFRGHPDLRRILLPTGFEGAPLRKDHALRPARGEETS
jgi:NADH-quinone oxidoreductase subunit C